MNLPFGYIFTLEQGWQLAKEWYHDRIIPDWRRKTPKEAKAIFDSIGLTGEFWDQ